MRSQGSVARMGGADQAHLHSMSDETEANVASFYLIDVSLAAPSAESPAQSPEAPFRTARPGHQSTRETAQPYAGRRQRRLGHRAEQPAQLTHPVSCAKKGSSLVPKPLRAIGLPM